jgi:hypothetical protein
MIKNYFAALFCLVSTALLAQPKLNAPYTRFGIGNIAPNYLAVQSGQGGLTTAFSDPYHLNLANPASFAYLRTTTLETGLFAQNSQFQSSTSNLNVWSGNLAYFALGFTLRSPINEALDRKRSPWRHGMGFSLTPYSLVGYDTESIDTLADVGIVKSRFEGSGGTYRLAWHGASRYKNTSFGATLGWLFGSSRYENTTSFADSLPTFENNFYDRYSVGGLVWKVGAQHDFVLKRLENDKEVPTKWITIGATAESKRRLNATSDVVRLRSRGKSVTSGQYLEPDTILLLTGVEKSVTLPGSFSLGIEYVSVDKFKIGAQATLENWSDYDNEVRPEAKDFNNTLAVAAGVEFIPDYASYNRYMKRVRYRFGGYYRQDPRIVANQDLTDLGITFGLGFPLILPRQQTSFINFGVEAGRFGANSPISETYVRMTLGFTFNDNTWFFKRRFE